MNETKLLPCPFCGATASGREIEAHEHSAPLKAMGIPDHPGSYVIEGDCECGSGLIGSTKEEVTKKWNRRAPSNCLHQIQEPSSAEQAAWHAGLDEGRAQAAQPEALQALRALNDSVELAMQRGELSESALEIIIMQPATDVLMRAASKAAPAEGSTDA